MKRRAYLTVVGAFGTAGCNSLFESTPAAEPSPQPTTWDVGIHDHSAFSVSVEELPTDEEYQILHFDDLSSSEQDFLDQLLPDGYAIVCGPPDPDGPINNIALRNVTNYDTYLEHEEAHYGLYIRMQDQVYAWTGDPPPHEKVEEKVREDCISNQN